MKFHDKFMSNFEQFQISIRKPKVVKGQSKFLHFFELGYFLFTSGSLEIIISLQGLQVWNPNMKHTQTHTDPNSHPVSHWSIGSHFWV